MVDRYYEFWPSMWPSEVGSCSRQEKEAGWDACTLGHDHAADPRPCSCCCDYCWACGCGPAEEG
jgi:hypothetical protein